MRSPEESVSAEIRELERPVSQQWSQTERKQEKMIGVVDVGGGMRGIYGAGVFDRCMEMGVSFDLCIGVSAGAANILSYAAGQKGRNLKFYTEYAFRKEYMGMKNLARRRNYINLDYIYGTLSNSRGEYPLDYKALLASGKQIQVVATNAINGKSVYFDLADMRQDHYDPVKASSCVPVVNRPYVIDQIPYFDGGLSDPIPVNRAFRSGCDKVVVVLTRPRDMYRVKDRDAVMARFLERSYPASAARLVQRAGLYNRQLDLIKTYEKKGKVLILAPADISGMKTLKKDREAMELMYREGYEDAAAVQAFLKQ